MSTVECKITVPTDKISDMRNSNRQCCQYVHERRNLRRFHNTDWQSNLYSHSHLMLRIILNSFRNNCLLNKVNNHNCLLNKVNNHKLIATKRQHDAHWSGIVSTLECNVTILTSIFRLKFYSLYERNSTICQCLLKLLKETRKTQMQRWGTVKLNK